MTRKSLVGQEQEVISLYLSGKGSGELSKYFEVSNVTILNILKRNGIDRRSMSDAKRQYTMNENFFSDISNEAQAYILGLLYADGYNNTAGNVVTLTVKDRYLAEILGFVANSDRPVTEHRSGKNIYYTGRLCHPQISSDLTIAGCIQNKTFMLSFPPPNILPISMSSHFIRGYFDGDGCIHRRKNSNKYCSYSWDSKISGRYNKI